MNNFTKSVSRLVCVVAVGLSAAVVYAQNDTPSTSTSTSTSTNSPDATPKPKKAKAVSKPYSGTVASVDRDEKTFTITLEKGKSKTLKVTAKTKFKKDGEAATFADVDLGELVKGSMHTNKSGDMVATTVNITAAQAAGAASDATK
jgi:hypothetical protein